MNIDAYVMDRLNARGKLVEGLITLEPIPGHETRAIRTTRPLGSSVEETNRIGRPPLADGQTFSSSQTTVDGDTTLASTGSFRSLRRSPSPKRES